MASKFMPKAWRSRVGWRVVLTPDRPVFKASIRWWHGSGFSALPVFDFYNEERAARELKAMRRLDRKNN